MRRASRRGGCERGEERARRQDSALLEPRSFLCTYHSASIIPILLASLDVRTRSSVIHRDEARAIVPLAGAAPAMLLATAAFWVIAFSVMIYFMLDEVRGLRRVVRMKVRDDPLRVVVSRALRDLSPLPSATTRRAVDPSDPHAPPALAARQGRWHRRDGRRRVARGIVVAPQRRRRRRRRADALHLGGRRASSRRHPAMTPFNYRSSGRIDPPRSRPFDRNPSRVHPRTCP